MTKLSTTQTGTFDDTGHIVTGTAGTAGYYDIGVESDQGGGALNDTAGGLGAMASGEIYLSAGAQLEMLIGAAAKIAGEFDAATPHAPPAPTGAINVAEPSTAVLSPSPSAVGGSPTTAPAISSAAAPGATTTFNYTGAIQTFTVTTAGYYVITADGAQGGAANGGASHGGLGAMASALGGIYLQAGATLEIVVGGAGATSGGFGGGGGGGGGSFVIETNNGSGAVDVNEVIAGGGGGGAGFGTIGDGGGGGRTQATGGAGGGVGGGAGGVNGAAGQGGAGAVPTTGGGGGGGGFTGGAGGLGNRSAAPGSTPGTITSATFAGGARAGGFFGGSGGFGGGGGGGANAGGGGGGGYGGGGGGGGESGGGGGGGSFVNESPFFASYTAGIHSGNGLVTIVYEGQACYCAGTRIATDKGEVAVEDLQIGDRLLTMAGALRPLKWIGTRAYSARFAGNNPDVLPIRFKAGSLAAGAPARDLLVSPDHAMFLDGVLIPAEHLVNGATIVKEPPGEDVHYFHLELETHDVLIAEGAFSESFVDDDSRGMFQNAHEFRELYPDESSKEAVYCAPRIEDGFALDRVRRRLAERAGIFYPAATDFGALLGAIETCDREGVSGWALNAAFRQAPVCLDVIVDGAFMAYAYAETARKKGGWRFDLRYPAALDPSREHEVELRRSADGARLGKIVVPDGREGAVAAA